MNLKTTGRNVIVQPVKDRTGLTREGKVMAIGEKVLSVSKDTVVKYNPVNVPELTTAQVPYVIISEMDILEIKEA